MQEYKNSHFPPCSHIYRGNVVYLYPGEYHFAKKPTLIHTLLGSCVAVILFDQAHQYGAMCHAVLDSSASAPNKEGVKCHRYMDCVLEEMINTFSEHGVSIQNLVAKIFGGAQVLLDHEKQIAASAGTGVGGKNTQMAMKVLQEYGCQIEATDLGGFQGRKIYFLSHKGDVYLKRIKKL